MEDSVPTRPRLVDPFWLDGWCVQPSANRLDKGETTVKLEPRAMQVLVYLAERAGEVVSRQRLETDVWRGVVVGYDSLSNAIAKLRKAFDDDPHHPKIIETIPKVGYRLIATVAESARESAAHGTEPRSDSAVVKRFSFSELPAAHLILGALTTLVALTTVSALVAWVMLREHSSIDELAVNHGTLLSNKPSIVVLPFQNLSGDPQQEYFSDGMTDDLITDLSRVSGLFVIARNSSFQYKGTSSDVRDIARDLGVRYVLEGSIRKTGQRIRINAQLVDATIGTHLWAERYDRTVADVFTLQDEVTRRIVAALKVRLTPREQAAAEGRDVADIAAYDAFLRGWALLLRKTPEDAARAITYFTQALEIDANYSRAYAALAQAYWDYSNDHVFNTLVDSSTGTWGPSGYTSYLNAWKYLHEARSRPSSQAHALSARMLQRQRRFDEAMNQAQQAVLLSPSDPAAYDVLIENLIYAGKTTKALDLIDESIRLDPSLPGEKLFLRGMAYYAMGRLEEAVSTIDRAKVHNPRQTRYTAIQAAALAELGRLEEAEAALESYVSGWVTYATLDWVMFHWPFQSQTSSERLANGLLKAGMTASAERYYGLEATDRLTGDEIKSLLANRTMKGADRSYYGVGADEFEVFRNEEIQIAQQGYLNYFRDGAKTRVEDDLLCDPWRDLGDYCVAIFRNPEGTLEARNEYVFFTMMSTFAFSVFDAKVSQR